MVAYANITISAKVLCDLLNYHVDIFTVESLDALEPKLKELQTEQYDTVLCDMTASIIARRLGFNAILITSGIESLRKALEQTLSLCRSHERLRQENSFFREILRGQAGKIVVLDNQNGEVFFSTMENLAPELLEVLRGALLLPGMEEERGLTKHINAMRYSIQARRVLFGSKSYTAFFVEERRIPLGPAQMGISYLSRQEAEDAIAERMQCLPGHELREQIRYFAGNTAPLVLCGERLGPEKETVVHLLYVQGPYRGSALVSIHCGLLHEKGWKFPVRTSQFPAVGQRTCDPHRTCPVPLSRAERPADRCAEGDRCVPAQSCHHFVCLAGGRADLRRGRTVAQWVGRTLAVSSASAYDAR